MALVSVRLRGVKWQEVTPDRISSRFSIFVAAKTRPAAVYLDTLRPPENASTTFCMSKNMLTSNSLTSGFQKKRFILCRIMEVLTEVRFVSYYQVM